MSWTEHEAAFVKLLSQAVRTNDGSPSMAAQLDEAWDKLEDADPQIAERKRAEDRERRTAERERLRAQLADLDDDEPEPARPTTDNVDPGDVPNPLPDGLTAGPGPAHTNPDGTPVSDAPQASVSQTGDNLRTRPPAGGDV